MYEIHNHAGRVLIDRSVYEQIVEYSDAKKVDELVRDLLRNAFKLPADFRSYSDLDLDRNCLSIVITTKQCPAENYPYKLPAVEEGEIIPIVGHITLRNGLLAFIPSD